jgi:hypothetical protein
MMKEAAEREQQGTAKNSRAAENSRWAAVYSTCIQTLPLTECNKFIGTVAERIADFEGAAEKESKSEGGKQKKGSRGRQQ